MPDISQLRHARDHSLDSLIAQYLEAVDAGRAIDPAQFIEQHPEHEPELRRYFENVAMLEELARSGSARCPAPPAADQASAPRGTFAATAPDAGTSVPTGGPESVVPEKLGRYRILRLLGQGAMGAVYEAHDPHLDRRIALKVPRFDAADGGEMLERFRREARSAAKLRHPNICPVHEVGEVDGRHYISMALIDGFTLREFARSGAAQPQREVALVIRKLALALAEAHRHGIIHRDLKSANIMVDESGEPIVMDFGLARCVAADEADVTRTGTILGTPAYMSPEQVAGDPRQIGPASDIYALGVVCYELLTGRLPFTGPVHSILRQITVDEPQPPSKLRPDLDPQLEAVCLKAMAPRVEDRYGSMDELAEDLRRFLSHEATRARPVGRLHRLRTWVRRHPLPSVLVGMVPVTAVAGICLAAWGLRGRSAAIDAHGVARDALATADDQSARTVYAQALLSGDQQGAELAMLRLAEGLQVAVDAGAHDVESSIRRQLGAWRQDLPALEHVFPQGGHLFAVAVSANGEFVATGGNDKTARIWDRTTGQPVATLQHGDTVFGVAFSPDSRLVLTGSADGMAQIWEASTGDRLGPPLPHHGRVLAVAFSPDGTLALTGSEDGTARLWNTETRESIGPPLEHRASVRCVAFSPQGDLIVTGGDDAAARLWWTASGQPTGQLLRHHAGDIVFAATFSPDGSKVLTGSSDTTAQLWDVATGARFGPVLQHQDWVMAADISPDGRTIMTATRNQVVRFWELDTGQLLRRLRHSDEVRAATFGPEATYVVTGSWDGGARLWRTSRATRLRNEMPVRAVVFGDDGSELFTCGASSVQRWDVVTGRCVETLFEHDRWVLCGAFSPDAQTVLACDDGAASLSDVASGRPAVRTLQHEGQVRVAAFSPDGSLVVTASRENLARIWDAATGRPACPPLQHRDLLILVAFGPDGRTVVTGSRDNTVQLWDVVTGERVGSPLVHAHAVSAIACSPDNSLVATASLDRLRIWDTRSSQPVGPSFRVQGTIRTLAFAPDGKVLFTGADDHTVCLWDITNGQRLGPPLKHPSRVETVAVSPDGRTLLTRCADTSLWLRPMFSPVAGTPEQVLLWTQVITGMELDEQDHARVLDPETWLKRRQQLASAE